MSKRKNNFDLLSGEQQQALHKFQRDANKVLPHMQAAAVAAKKLHKAMLDAPLWQIAETERPEGVSEPQMWTVGHAKVNYVDHIDTKDEGTQDK